MDGLFIKEFRNAKGSPFCSPQNADDTWRNIAFSTEYIIISIDILVLNYATQETIRHENINLKYRHESLDPKSDRST